MSPARLASILVSALLLSVAPVTAQDKPPPTPPAANPTPPKGSPETQVDWVASFSEALRLAREQKKPVLVVYNMDDEVANDAMAKVVYHDPKFVEKSRKFVCVASSIYKHDEPLNDHGLAECARFGRITCAQHKECEIRSREALLEGNVVIAPQHVVCNADGSILARRAWQMSLDEMLVWMTRALKAAGVDASPAEIKAEKAKIAELLDQSEKARTWQKREHIRKIVEFDDDIAREALSTYAIKGKDDETRVAILECLGVAGDYTVLDVLRKVSHDGQSYVALAAIDAMGRTRLPELKEDLKKLLSNFSAGNDYGRTLRAYAACGHDDKAVRELVLKKAKGSDQNICCHALVALGTMEPAPEIRDFLKKMIEDRATNTRACAAWAAGMGRYKELKKQLERLASNETAQDLKDLAAEAAAHLDHDPANKSCCGLEWKITRFVTLGDTRR